MPNLIQELDALYQKAITFREGDDRTYCVSKKEAFLMMDIISRWPEIKRRLEAADELKLAGEKLKQHLEQRKLYWSLENHTCHFNNETREDVWGGYCGFEMEHGIEAEELQKEIDDALEILKKEE